MPELLFYSTVLAKKMICKSHKSEFVQHISKSVPKEKSTNKQASQHCAWLGAWTPPASWPIDSPHARAQ